MNVVGSVHFARRIKMFLTIIIGEEEKSKVKAFLIAPTHITIQKGECVKARNVSFNVLFVERYHNSDDVICKALGEALGDPIQITSAIHEEIVEWGDDDELSKLDG